MFQKILIALAVFIAIYFVIASQSLSSIAVSQTEEKGIDFGQAVDADYSGMPDLTKYMARDGAKLGYRFYASAASTDRVIILVHGSSWHGMQFHKMASDFARSGLGDVVLPDLRGHGPEAVTKGTINHISQLEEDMADLIETLKEVHGAKKEVVLGGYSSGGGFVVRFASGEYGSNADKLILLAPFLKHDAPTTRPNSGNWAYPAVRRIIGLSMLNGVGIHTLDFLPVMKFNMPKSILESELGDTATVEYSHALNAGFAPRGDYKKDLARLKQPLMLLVGSKDETFFAKEYEPLMSQFVKNGTYEILDGVDHIGLVFNDDAIGKMSNWISAN